MSTTTNERSRPFLEEKDGEILAGIINNLVDSFDVAELSNEEAILAYVLLDRMMDALWNEHRVLLFGLYGSMMIRAAQDDDPDDEVEDGSNGGTTL